MKKLLVFISIFSILAATAGAEAIKLKSGVIINGSIVGQTEYVLSVQTSYGTISINQREVDIIMPDLHRVLMKGGGEFVGNVLDMDQFNLSLKTDKGVVNLDVAQIASMEIYDYGEAEKQKKFVERKIELEKEALKTLPDSGVSAATAAEAAAGGTLSTSGLAFDPDLEKAFPSKPAVVEPQQIYNYRMNTFQGQEIKDAAPEEPAAPLLREEETDEQIKIKEFASNFVAINAGIMNTSLKLGNLNAYSGDMQVDMGGNAASFGAEYRRKMSERWWFGGGLSFGFISKKYVEIDPVREMKISGQTVNLDLFLHYYFNPKSKTRVYLTAGGNGNFVGFDKNNYFFSGGFWETETTKSSNSFVPGVLGAVGVERSIQDINIGLEARGTYNSYGGDLQGSRNINYYLLLKAGWFF